MDTKELLERAATARELCAKPLPNQAFASPDYCLTMAGKTIEELMQAVTVLSTPAIADSSKYRYTQEQLRTARAENNAASIKLELMGMKDRCAELMSQHEPVASIGIDREQLRQALHFVICGRLK